MSRPGGTGRVLFVRGVPGRQEFDAGVVFHELRRVGLNEQAETWERIATAGFCTMNPLSRARHEQAHSTQTRRSESFRKVASNSFFFTTNPGWAHAGFNNGHTVPENTNASGSALLAPHQQLRRQGPEMWTLRCAHASGQWQRARLTTRGSGRRSVLFHA